MKEITFHRPEIDKIAPAYHGAFDFAELENLALNPANVLDFSVNSNPYGPSPRVAQALAAVPVDRYPDREAIALRRALAARLNLPPDNFVIGNGTAELFWLLAFATLSPGDPVLIIEPTFGEYRRVSKLMGAVVHTFTAPPPDFAIDPATVAAQLAKLRPRLVFVCNPNNPTGQTLPPAQIAAWTGQQPDALFVVDESYLGFTPALASALTVPARNVLVVRSMTKDYALAGLRLGFAASHNHPLIAAIAAVRPAWNVSGLAQAAGLAALADEAYLQQCLADLYRAKAELLAGLTGLGFAPAPSATHYFLMPVGAAAGFRLKLLRQGLLVRDCASFGLPEYVRIATRRAEQNARLIDALRIGLD
ncbi:MAG: Histidinol-phosphate aminotransferase [Anaerolineae bacterium]|nr:Histidinol-phosphate aminotransferase [Anaerolineae bacterium]